MDYFVEKEESVVITEEEKSLVNTFMVCHRGHPTPIYRRQDTRTDNTNMLDFLHGRSLRFKRFKRSVKGTSCSPLCLDCQSEEDTPLHKIFYCNAFENQHRTNLLEVIGAENTTDFRLHFLFSTNGKMRRVLKKQIKYICDTSLNDDEYYGNDDT